MPTTTGMKGGGYYDAHSGEQRVAMEAFLPWLEEAIDDLPALVDGQASLDMLDIGSSEGANAIYALNRLITRIRSRSDVPVRVCLDDLATNDFNQLFANLFPNGTSKFAGADVFPCAIGGTAFGRLVPPGSLHIATTFNAIGFLDTKPEAALPNFILPMPPGPKAPRPGVSVSDSEQAPFRKQAEKDMENFFVARAAELVRGGKLLVQVFGRDEDVSTSHGIYDVLSDAVLDCVDQGILPAAVYENLIFPIYFRSLDELIAPLYRNEHLAGVFQIEKAAAREVPVPFNIKLTETSDTAEWARSYAGFLRAFTESILASSLPDDLPGPQTLERIYQQVERRLAADPARYEFRYLAVGALLSRL